jgi:hypothetical protein
MKVLIIGFQKFNEGMYPHTFEIIRELQKENNVTYYCFRIGDILSIFRLNGQNIKSQIYFLYRVFMSIVDACELFVIGRRYNYIITFNQFIYLLCRNPSRRKKVKTCEGYRQSFC